MNDVHAPCPFCHLFDDEIFHYPLGMTISEQYLLTHKTFCLCSDERFNVLAIPVGADIKIWILL